MKVSNSIDSISELLVGLETEIKILIQFERCSRYLPICPKLV